MVGHQPKRFDWPDAKADLIAILGEDPGDAMLAVPASTANDTGMDWSSVQCLIALCALMASSIGVTGRPSL